MKILLVTPDLHPPWNHGTKVFARGLLDTIRKIQDSEISYTDNVNNIPEGNNGSAAYDFVHIVYAGSDQTNKVSSRFNTTPIFKHIFTPSVSMKNALSTKLYYSLIKSSKPNIVKCFSSEYVAQSYFMTSEQILPPAIDTQMFSNAKEISGEHAFKIIESSDKSAWIGNVRDISDGLILYSGPLSEDRFPYKLVLDAVKRSKSKILILGRHTNYALEVEAMDNIIQYARKLDMEDRVTIALKILDDKEKIDLLNFADLIIQPFDSKIKYVAVDPPIFILESMACCTPVITSNTYSLNSIIKNGENGFVIDWNNPDAFAGALSDCLERKDKMGSSARQTILQDFSHESVKSKLERMYCDFK